MFVASLSAWLFIIGFILIVVALFLKVSIDRRRYHADHRSYFLLTDDEQEGTITITNYGPGHMINCFIRLTVDDGGERDIHIPMIAEQGSTVFAVPKGMDVNAGPSLQKIHMEYQTQSEERIKYYQTAVQENNVRTITHALYKVGILTSGRLYEYHTTKIIKSPS